MIRFGLKNSLRFIKSFNSINKFHFSNLKINKKNLVRTLNNEIKTEVDNYSNDEQINNFLKEKNWEIEDHKSSNHILLKKIIGDTEINVLFFSKPPQSNEEEEMDQENNENQEENENDQNYQDSVDFCVYIKGENKNLFLSLYSMEGEMSITNARVIDNVEEHMNKLKILQEDRTVYEGPDFGLLDQNLSNSFLEYINSLGIDEDLCVFIEHVAIDKEQRLYMNWLEEMKSFFN